MEEMPSELPQLIESTGANLTEDARSELETLPAANRSQHRPYAEYYGSALRDLVAERDSSVIKRFGYSFGT